MHSGLFRLVKPQAFKEAERAVETFDINPDRPTQGLRFGKNVLEYGSSDPGVSILREKCEVENPNLFITARDVNPTGAEIVYKYDPVLAFGKSTFIMLLLCGKLKAEEGVFLSLIPSRMD
jgi:hypothetical protein